MITSSEYAFIGGKPHASIHLSRLPATRPGRSHRRPESLADFFVSGTVKGQNVGYIRIPAMPPTRTATALSKFAAEIKYCDANIDGLVIRVIGNGGGTPFVTAFSRAIGTLVAPVEP